MRRHSLNSNFFVARAHPSTKTHTVGDHHTVTHHPPLFPSQTKAAAFHRYPLCMGCSASHLDGRQRLQSLSGKFFWLRPLQLQNPCALVDAPSRAINAHRAFDHFIADPRIPNACFLVQVDVSEDGVRVSSRPFFRKRSGKGEHEPLGAWRSIHFQCCGTRRFSVLLRQDSHFCSSGCNTHVEWTVRSGTSSTCTVLVERHLGVQVVSTNCITATTGQWGFETADAALAALHDVRIPTDADPFGGSAPATGDGGGATHRTQSSGVHSEEGDAGALEDCWATAALGTDSSAAQQLAKGNRVPRRHPVFGERYFELVASGTTHNFAQLRDTAGDLIPIWVASFVVVQSRRCTVFVQSLFPTGTLVIDGSPAVPASRHAPSPARERRHRATVNFGAHIPFAAVELPLSSFFSARIVFGSYCLSPARLHDPEANYAIVFKPPVDVMHQLGEPTFPLSLVFDEDDNEDVSGDRAS